MSAIDQFLRNILSARKGRDVRSSIHDAIFQCYSDVSNPTLQTEALETAIQNKIDSGEMSNLVLENDAVTTPKIKDGAVTKAKLDPNISFDADPTLDETSTNAIQNKAVASAISELNGSLGDHEDRISILEAGKGLSDVAVRCIVQLLGKAEYTEGMADVYATLIEETKYTEGNKLTIERGGIDQTTGEDVSDNTKLRAVEFIDISDAEPTVKIDYAELDGTEVTSDIFKGVKAEIKGINANTGELIASTNRVITELIPIGVINPLEVTAVGLPNIGIKVWGYKQDKSLITPSGTIGNATTDTASGNINPQTVYIRIIVRKLDDSGFTETEANKIRFIFGHIISVTANADDTGGFYYIRRYNATKQYIDGSVEYACRYMIGVTCNTFIEGQSAKYVRIAFRETGNVVPVEFTGNINVNNVDKYSCEYSM